MCSRFKEFLVPISTLIKMCLLLFAVIVQVLAASSTPLQQYATRVVGGTPTDIEGFPFAAQMLMDTWGNGRFEQICAATVLTTRHLLSAAHCYQYNKDTGRDYRLPQFWNVRVGSSYRGYGGQLFGVQRIVSHPAFNRTLYDNDVAVVVLPTHLQLGATVRQGTIPEQGAAIPDGAAVTLIGWGAQSTGGAASDRLMSVGMRTVNRGVCRGRYATISAAVSDTMMCAGLVDSGGADGCHGDSGGPLLYNGVVVGVVSFGYSCGHAYYPGVYSKVSSFTSWIIYTVDFNK